MEDIKGLLIDLDGVIYNDSELIPGAKESIQWLQDQKLPFRFVTNTTMKSRKTLKQKLQSFGIEVVEKDIFTTVDAAVLYIRKSGKEKCHLLLMDDVREEFREFILDAENPDFVVVGDLGEKLSFRTVNVGFQKLFSGAELLALQKNRYWLSDKGYMLDAGALVAMLEFSSGKKAQIIGKPSPHFFSLALNDLNLSPDNVVMIGDDIESDIFGAQRMGMRGVLVQTGKFLPADLDRKDVKPWKLIDNIGDLHKIFKTTE
jgi:HAD superfamily hydrolase (TIGR01458 family)